MAFRVDDLLSILDLERIEVNIFRGRSPQVGWQRVFGGLVIAQALVAAARTVEGRAPHALHGFFMRPGDPAVPIVFEVERLRDGGSFSTRQCTAVQHGEPIFTLAASFHAPEAGFEHQLAMPDVPAPETLPSESDLMARFGSVIPEGIRRYFARERPVELRPVDLSRYVRLPGTPPGPPVQHVWMRATGQLPDDPAVHRAVLAYFSDMTLLEVALAAHNRSLFEPTLQVASLDHSLWFHRPFRADDWMLYTQDSPTTTGARGLARGAIFARDGRMIASVAQEGLIRDRGLAPALPNK